METHQNLRLKRPSTSDDERALLALARRGDEGAADRLVRSHYAEIQRAAGHLLGNADDAQDLTQDCFVKALGGLRRYRGEGSFRGWLRRILVHLAHDRYRARARRPRLAAPGFEADEQAPTGGAERPSPSAASLAGRAELTRLVDAAVAALPPNLRVPLVLRAVEGWSYEEIAEACGVTPATARTQVMKARRRLHERVGDVFEEDPS